ncbi:Hypothetical predicted protein, partial [Octopus vulgaris]
TREGQVPETSLRKTAFVKQAVRPKRRKPRQAEDRNIMAIGLVFVAVIGGAADAAVVVMVVVLVVAAVSHVASAMVYHFSLYTLKSSFID